jgi:hypothetical protein
MSVAGLSAGTQSSVRWGRPLVALGAALAPVLVYLVCVPLLDVEVTVPEEFGSSTFADLDLGPVVGASILAVLLGWAFLAVLERIVATRALTIWTVVAVVVLITSLPWNPDFSTGERLVIGSMHLALALVLIVGMRRTAVRSAG